MHCTTHRIKLIDDTKIRLAQVVQKPGDKMEYIYDIGDNYKHIIRVEAVEDRTSENYGIIQLLDGARACPPEDGRSSFGYAERLCILKKGYSHPNYDETLDDILSSANYSDAKSFDPEYFNLVKTQRALSKILGTALSPNDARNFTTSYIKTGLSVGGEFKERKLDKELKPEKICFVCKSTNNLKLCGKCKIIYYCSREHQSEDWKRHKKECCKDLEIK